MIGLVSAFQQASRLDSRVGGRTALSPHPAQVGRLGRAWERPARSSASSRSSRDRRLAFMEVASISYCLSGVQNRSRGTAIYCTGESASWTVLLRYR
jgi:hypothetical protein